jgi:hypothetical protein
MSNPEMTSGIYFLTLAVMFGTILVVFGMKYFSAVYAARARVANDTALQSLAEKAVAAQSENQVSLTAIQAELANIAASLAAVEKILKQVG